MMMQTGRELKALRPLINNHIMGMYSMMMAKIMLYDDDYMG